MKSHHRAKFGGQTHWGSRDVIFLVVEGQDSTCPCLTPPLLSSLETSSRHAQQS